MVPSWLSQERRPYPFLLPSNRYARPLCTPMCTPIMSLPKKICPHRHPLLHFSWPHWITLRPFLSRYFWTYSLRWRTKAQTSNGPNAWRCLYINPDLSILSFYANKFGELFLVMVASIAAGSSVRSTNFLWIGIIGLFSIIMSYTPYRSL